MQFAVSNRICDSMVNNSLWLPGTQTIDEPFSQISNNLFGRTPLKKPVKWFNIWKPIFGGQCTFNCIIKSTHPCDVPKAKSWDLGAHTVPWGPISVLGLK